MDMALTADPWFIGFIAACIVAFIVLLNDKD